MLLVLIVLVLNFVISFWNAYAVGTAWVESKHYGGWPRFMVWMGAIMSALGFTWCFLIVLVLIAGLFGVSPQVLEVTLQLGYLVIVPGVLFAGIMIMVDSWARAYRTRTLADTSIAGYNTFVVMYNSYHAIDSFGDAFGNVLEFFKFDSDDDSSLVFLVIALVVIALLAGVFATVVIIRRTAASADLQAYS